MKACPRSLRFPNILILQSLIICLCNGELGHCTHQTKTNDYPTMKTTILLLLSICLAPLLFNACSTGSGYNEWKSNNSGPSGAANPYGVPRAGGEAGSYPQAPTSPANAAYQPLPPIGQAGQASAATPPQATAALTNDLAANTIAPPSATTTYTVVAGDSLWGIARKHSTSVQAIQSANALTNTTIKIGQRLNIPSN